MIIDVGFSVEREWARAYGEVGARADNSREVRLKSEAARWKQGAEELMSWLRWAEDWTRCTKKCGWDVSAVMFHGFSSCALVLFKIWLTYSRIQERCM